jgi:carbon storage regulator CsrA
VVITVLSIQGGTVKLGIEAPRQMHVMHTELITPVAPTPGGSR